MFRSESILFVVCKHNVIIHLLKGPDWFSQHSNSLRGEWLRFRIPMGPRDVLFSTPVQPGFGTHLASCTIGAWAVPGVKHLWCGTEHTLPMCLRGM